MGENTHTYERNFTIENRRGRPACLPKYNGRTHRFAPTACLVILACPESFRFSTEGLSPLLKDSRQAGMTLRRELLLGILLACN